MATEKGSENMNQTSGAILQAKMVEFRFNKMLFGSIVVVVLFIVQMLAGKTGWAIADLF
jgi:cell division protein FtsL